MIQRYADVPVRPRIAPVRNFQIKNLMPNSCTNNPGRASCDASFNSRIHLLDAIRATMASVGEALNDDELTRLLLLDIALPTEAGFTFLSFSGGVVTLSVPKQDLAKWYPEQGWVSPEKEEMAKSLGEKYGLTLCEPPDRSSSSWFPDFEQARVHHHLELVARRETIVVVHPQYLKVRMYCDIADTGFTKQAAKPLALGSDLLEELSALYRN